MSLKIFFGGSIKGGREDEPLYIKILKELEKYGEIIGAWKDMIADEETYWETYDTTKKRHDLVITQLEEMDVMVSEVTVTSVGVGYEIGRAIAMGKPILCLFRPDASEKALSCMIDGAHNGSTVVVKQYKDTEYQQVIKEYFANLKAK